ncbi:MAG: hypothetical protein R3C58_03620 [Parvularculaceae bacterium]
MAINAGASPDDRLANLAGWPLRPALCGRTPGGCEGLHAIWLMRAKDADVTFLMIHGEPSWA